MGRYYKRRHYSRRSRRRKNDTAMIFLAIIFWPITIVILIILLTIKIINKTNQKEHSDTYENQEVSSTDTVLTSNNYNNTDTQTSYISKGSIMSNCEKEFFEAIREVVGDDYIVQPQINLASVIDKESVSAYRNELFRNIDFGIFDKNYNILLLIEINDRTHNQSDRIERDKKVQSICDNAGIPLIAFWTKYGVNREYIRKSLSKYLPLNTNFQSQTVQLSQYDENKFDTK